MNVFPSNFNIFFSNIPLNSFPQQGFHMLVVRCLGVDGCHREKRRHNELLPAVDHRVVPDKTQKTLFLYHERLWGLQYPRRGLSYFQTRRLAKAVCGCGWWAPPIQGEESGPSKVVFSTGKWAGPVAALEPQARGGRLNPR